MSRIRLKSNSRNLPDDQSAVKGYGREVPPDQHHVLIWFLQKGGTENAALAFYKFYEERRWLNAKGELIKDWKVKAWEWLWQD